MRITIRRYVLLLLAIPLACVDKGSTDTAGIGSSGDGPGTDGLSSTGPSNTGGDVVGTSLVPDTTGTDTTATGGDMVGTSLIPDTSPTTAATTGFMETTHAVTTDHTTGDTTGVDTDPGGTTADPVASCEGSNPAPLDVELLSYVDGQLDPDSDDPTLLYIRLSNQSFTCDDPHAWLPCGGNWDLSIRLPEAFQTPGLYSLWLGGEVMAFGSEHAGLPGEIECDGGGGQVTGTLEITAIDDKTVTGRLCNVTWHGLDNDFGLDGSFVAPRCPP
jgi:hypothetical protein